MLPVQPVHLLLLRTLGFVILFPRLWNRRLVVTDLSFSSLGLTCLIGNCSPPFSYMLTSRCSQEKAALAKELHEKSTVLAGVKDKTKAYVEKLNKEKAEIISALEVQVSRILCPS